MKYAQLYQAIRQVKFCAQNMTTGLLRKAAGRANNDTVKHPTETREKRPLVYAV